MSKRYCVIEKSMPCDIYVQFSKILRIIFGKDFRFICGFSSILRKVHVFASRRALRMSSEVMTNHRFDAEMEHHKQAN